MCNESKFAMPFIPSNSAFDCVFKFSYCIKLLTTIPILSGTDGNIYTNLHITTMYSMQNYNTWLL